MRLCAHLFALAVAHEADRRLDKIAHDLIDVAADIANLGELRRLDLEEGRIGELSEPPRNFGLADAGRADHEDIFRKNLLRISPSSCWRRQRLRSAWRPRACSACADDIAVQFGDDFRGEKFVIFFPIPAASERGRMP